MLCKSTGLQEEFIAERMILPFFSKGAVSKSTGLQEEFIAERMILSFFSKGAVSKSTGLQEEFIAERMILSFFQKGAGSIWLCSKKPKLQLTSYLLNSMLSHTVFQRQAPNIDVVSSIQETSISISL